MFVSVSLFVCLLNFDDNVNIDHVILDVNKAMKAVREDAHREITAGNNIGHDKSHQSEHEVNDAGNATESDDDVINIATGTEIDSSGDERLPHPGREDGDSRSANTNPQGWRRKRRRKKRKNQR